MKRLLICLLALLLLLTMTIAVSAEDSTGDEGEPTEPGGTGDLTFVPSEEHLPDGYEVDPDFYLTITLDEDNNWSVNLAEILEGAEADEYIYFLVEEEENTPAGYTPNYSWGVATYSAEAPGKTAGITGITKKDSSDGTSGNLLVVTNVKDGEPPIYELPESGGAGAGIYMFVGVALLGVGAVYGLLLRRKKRQSAQ